MVRATFTPILPSRPKLIDGDRMAQQLEARMRTFADKLHERGQDYEAPPTEHYRRTFKLKRSWGAMATVRWENGNLIGEAISKGSAVGDARNWKVKGPRAMQRADFRGRGWKSIDDIMEDEWPRAEQEFKNIIVNAGK